MRPIVRVINLGFEDGTWVCYGGVGKIDIFESHVLPGTLYVTFEHGDRGSVSVWGVTSLHVHELGWMERRFPGVCREGY